MLTQSRSCFLPHHHLPSMTARSHHCILGETDLSLSIDATSEASQISASVVYNLNLPCISGLQCSSVDIKVPTANSFYASQMNLTVSHPTCFLVLTGYFPANPPSSTITHSSLTPLSKLFKHSLILISGNSLMVRPYAFVRVLSSDVPFSYSQSGSIYCNLPACSA